MTDRTETASGAAPDETIVFQGYAGAYSDLACRQVYPGMTTRPCVTFEEAFAAVEQRTARLAMIPIENSVAGRVADIHQLIPHTRLHIVAEHFQRVEHCLLAPRGATLAGLEVVRSHVHALSQCRRFIAAHGLRPVVHADTAGAAREVAEKGDPRVAAIASSLAAEIYGLDALAANIEDAAHNTTRFVILAHDAVDPGAGNGPMMTAFLFRVRNIPAALYKALGGFATNGVNMTKLESYMVNGNFASTEFYAEVEGHPDDRLLALAFEELRFYSERIRILGTFPQHPFRRAAAANGG